ncbi:hypothetical protein HY493_01785 [Candidatus Woesearchaeota archaeon]|nr:hypothetical protein [Candidatus Woesearchaeota archaeon]
MVNLSDWINQTYLDKGVVEEMRAVFAKNRQLLLPDFLCKDSYKHAMRLARSAAFKRAYVPDQMSCAFAMRQDAFLRFLASERFASYVQLITGTKSGKRAFYTELRARDYTVIKDLPQTWKLLTHLFLSPWNAHWGGRMIFRDAEGNHTHSPPAQNTLLLTGNRKGLHGYVEYVNHHAGKRTTITANV